MIIGLGIFGANVNNVPVYPTTDDALAALATDDVPPALATDDAPAVLATVELDASSTLL